MTPKITRPTPIPASYWLIDGMLLAGQYPGAANEDAAREKLTKFLDAGIRTFIDLTEHNEPLEKYDAHLRTLAAERSVQVTHFRHGIRDVGVPRDRAQMQRILETIREEIGAGRPVYVHCWGGIGRTGTVAGCWLVESGLAGQAAIDRIAELRKGMPNSAVLSPETDAQRRYICSWGEG